jgi:hypothetical protein
MLLGDHAHGYCDLLVVGGAIGCRLHRIRCSLTRSPPCASGTVDSSQFRR